VNFLNVGPWELTVILIIAILLVGPKRVLEVIQSIRRLATKLRGMSGEFTSLLHTEAQASEEEGDETREGTPEATDGDEGQPGETRGDTIGELKDIVREGIAPIVEIRSELQSAVQEPRQSLEGLVEDDIVGSVTGVQDDLQAAVQQTRQTLEESIQEGIQPIADLQAEFQSAAQEASQAVEKSAQEGAEEIADARAELKTAVQEASQALEDAATGEPKSKGTAKGTE